VPTYADIEAVRTYLERVGVFEELPPDEATAAELIEQAEADVDRVLRFDLPRNSTTGRKLDPDALTIAQRVALERAVAIQTGFRLAVGEEELMGADADVLATDNVRLGPTPRPPSPAALEALSGLGFPWRSGSVAAPAEGEES